MERLTERWSDSVVKLKGCSNVYANVERKRAHIQNAIVRLASYEDSGLMPDEIIELETLWDMYGGEEGITNAFQAKKRLEDWLNGLD